MRLCKARTQAGRKCVHRATLNGYCMTHFITHDYKHLIKNKKASFAGISFKLIILIISGISLYYCYNRYMETGDWFSIIVGTISDIILGFALGSLIFPLFPTPRIKKVDSVEKYKLYCSNPAKAPPQWITIFLTQEKLNNVSQILQYKSDKWREFIFYQLFEVK